MTNIKQKLLLGTALVAVAGFAGTAHAVDTVRNPADGAGTLVVDGDTSILTNADNKFANIDANAQTAIGDSGNDNTGTTSIAIKAVHTGNTLYLYDSDAAAVGTLTIGDGTNDVAVHVADTKTLTLEIGRSSVGATTANNAVNVIFNGDVDNNATGILNINTNAGTTAQTITFKGLATDLGTGTVTLGDALDVVVLDGKTGGDQAIAFTGNIAGKGTLTLVGNAAAADTTAHVITGNVGQTNQRLAKVNVGNIGTVDADKDTHTINGALYADNVNFGTVGSTVAHSADSVLALTGNTTSSTIGTVTTTVNGEGNLLVSAAGGTGQTVQTGNIGTTTHRLNDIGVYSDTENANLQVSGSVYADRILLENGAANTATLTFNGTGTAKTPQIIDATIDAGITATTTGTLLGATDNVDNDGNVVVGTGASNSYVVFTKGLGTLGGFVANDSASSLGNLTVTKGSTAVLGYSTLGTVNGTQNDFDGNLVTDGTLRLGQATRTDVADVAAGANVGRLEFVVGTTATGVQNAAKLNLTGDAINWDEFDGTTANSQKVHLVQGSGVILNNQEFHILTGTGAVTNLAAGGEVVADDYALFDFRARTGTDDLLVGTGANDVSVRATHVHTRNITETANNSSAAKGLLGTTAAEYDRSRIAGDKKFADVYDYVTRSTVGQVDERLEALQATVDGGNVVAGLNVANVTGDIVQLASAEKAGSGIAAGNIGNGLRAWAQVFGQTGEQDARDGIDGYDIDTLGFAVGLDTRSLADQMLFGIAFSYANSDVDSENANRTQTEVDTYQITLYGTYNVDEATYISGQLGYAFGDNETHRHDIGGLNTVDAKGDFDSNQFIARLEAGRAYEAGSITTLTPKLLANYNYYDADGYTETGAGGAGLRVDQDTLHVFELGAGLDVDWLFQQADGSYVKPMINVGFRYDLADDQVETTNSFIGGGNAFKTEGWDPQQFTLDLGAGVTYFSNANWELTADYDFEWKEDYTSHAGFLRAGYKF